MNKKLWFFCGVFYLGGCIDLASIIKEDSHGLSSNNIRVTNGKKVEVAEANELVSQFIKSRNIGWGKPKTVRNAPGRYIYIFSTPKKEFELKGSRMLKVDIYSGEVSIPTNGGQH